MTTDCRLHTADTADGSASGERGYLRRMTDARARSGAGNGEDPDVPPDGYPGEQPRDGRVVVFLGVAGGVGTTTLCANTAQALGALGPPHWT